MNAVVVEIDDRVPLVGVGHRPSAVLGLGHSVTDREDAHLISSLAPLRRGAVSRRTSAVCGAP